MKANHIILFHLLLFSWIDSIAQSVSLPELLRIPYVSHAEKEQREYFVYLPYGFRSGSPDRLWPVIVFLHGNGERGNGRDELDWVLKHGPLYEAWVQKRDLPFVIISPQLPMYGMDEIHDWIKNRNPGDIPRRQQAGVPEREPEFDTVDPMTGAVQDSLLPFLLPSVGWEKCEEDIMDMVAHVQKAYKGDPDRVYLTGLSYGGYGTWYLAHAHPEIWAAINPIAGWGHPLLMAPIAKHHIPVWAFAGGRDTAVPLKYFYPGLNALEKMGHTDVRFTIEADMGHDVWKRVYAGEDIYTWFLSNKLE